MKGGRKLKPLMMVLFEKENVDDILRILNVEEKDGFIVDEKGQRVTCRTCGGEIKKEKLGNVVPASPKKLFFCDNPFCFADYISEERF